ncbi:Acetaldehyde dehydrogenase [compost metagenome]
MPHKVKVAIIGPGNIGTDLMIKVMRNSKYLEMGAMVGVDPESDGLARASRLRVATTSDGIEGLLRLEGFRDIDIVFDATSASAHARHNEVLQREGVQVIDLTPAAIGPYVIPAINLEEEDSPNMNMVTCGGQATIPMVAAVSRVAKVHYAEIVASIASKSAGPGTRANIDEFTETTRKAIELIGGAERGKAIIVLNPAEPPLIMRDTVFVLSEPADREAVEQSIANAFDAGARVVRVATHCTEADVSLKHVFRLPLRALQGFACSLRKLAFADLPVPNYTTLSRRAQDLNVVLPEQRPGQALHLVVDSTGLKVFGEGEWKVRKHGYSKRRTSARCIWRWTRRPARYARL